MKKLALKIKRLPDKTGYLLILPFLSFSHTLF